MNLKAPIKKPVFSLFSLERTNGPTVPTNRSNSNHRTQEFTSVLYPLRQVSTLTRSECFRQEAVFPNGFLHKLVAETDPEKTAPATSNPGSLIVAAIMQIGMLLVIFRPIVKAPFGSEFDVVHKLHVGTLIHFIRVTLGEIRNVKTDRVHLVYQPTPDRQLGR